MKKIIIIQALLASIIAGIPPPMKYSSAGIAGVS